MLKAKLIVVGGDAKAKEVELKLPTIIGRGKDVTLTLPHPLVSRQHCELDEQSGWLVVNDLGSLNGTYVNNRRIKNTQKLPPNHLLTLGNVTFRAVYERPVATDAIANSIQNGDEETINIDDQNRQSVSTAGASHRPSEPSTPEVLETPEVENSPLLPSAEIDQPRIPQPTPSIAETPVSQSKSFGESSIFSDQDGLDFITPDQSISISALDSLPSNAKSASISAVNNQLFGLGGGEKLAIDSIDLEVPGNPVSSDSDPDLGSFLKKLPR